MNGFSYFIGKAETELGKCLMIKNSPNDTVIKSKVASFEFSYTVISLAVGHIKKAKIR